MDDKIHTLRPWMFGLVVSTIAMLGAAAMNYHGVGWLSGLGGAILLGFSYMCIREGFRLESEIAKAKLEAQLAALGGGRG